MPETTSERVLTPRLIGFLLLVVSVVGVSVAGRFQSPGIEGCIELLADGDLDLEERQRTLRRTASLGADSDARGQVAGCLAALALQDRAAFADAVAALDAVAELAPDELRWLDLGDPLLANVLRARRLEVEDRAGAKLAWGQVAAQARMVGNRVAREQAVAAAARLQ